MTKILLIEDDPSLGYLVKDNLEGLGYEVLLKENGKSALEVWRERKFDLLIVDVMLPVMDGFSMVKEVRKSDAFTPVIFLTAKDQKEDKIMGFKSGGDDYITKPFSMEELVLRIEALMKRTHSASLQAKQVKVNIGEYRFDHKNVSLEYKKETRQLTQKEADLLWLFYNHANKLLKREIILKEIWGEDDYFLGRSLDVFITRLRKYLSKDSSIKIRNVHGIGFQLDLETGRT